MSLDEKVIKYEEFVNERLKPDLRKALEARDKVTEEISEYHTLRGTILKLLESGQTSKLKTQMDLGCGVFVNAVIPDASRIFVKLGYGFFAELDLEPASEFCLKRIELLEERVKQCDQQANLIKANITMVLQGLAELQNLESPE